MVVLGLAVSHFRTLTASALAGVQTSSLSPTKILFAGSEDHMEPVLCLLLSSSVTQEKRKGTLFGRKAIFSGAATKKRGTSWWH